MIAPVQSLGDRYSRSVAYYEEEEAKLWKAVQGIEDGDTSPGARSLRSRHGKALQAIFMEHAERIRGVADASRGSFAPKPPPPPKLAEKRGHITVVGRKPGSKKQESIILLRSIHGEDLEDMAELVRWKWEKAGYQVEEA